MAAESDLNLLLKAAAPELIEGQFVFVSFQGARYGDLASLRPVAVITEREGLTMILERGRAEAAALHDGPVFSLISLGVHSSLDAVGLTAAVSGALAEHGIPANMLAGFYHDHVFVPVEFADQAMNLLKGLSDRRQA